MRRWFGVVCALAAAGSALGQLELAQWGAATSATVRVDARAVALASGREALPTALGEVACDGAALAGGDWETAALTDGWHTLTAEAATNAVSVLTLNGPGVQVHGGRLGGDARWGAESVQVVRHWVVVPSGVTLSVQAGTVVKFAEGSGLWVEDGGKLEVEAAEAGSYATFTALADDARGGDSDWRAGEGAGATWQLVLAPNATFVDNGLLEARYGASVPRWGSVSIGDAVTSELYETVRVPITVSGTRTEPLTVAWETADGTAVAGEDYGASAGRLTWQSGESTTKYAEIPILQDEVSEETEHFKVRIVLAYGLNITRAEATVTLNNYDPAEGPFGALAHASGTSEAVRIDARETLGGRLAHGTVALSEVAGEVACDGAAVAEGLWETAALADGLHTLVQAESEARVTTLNTPAVHIAYGRLSEDTTWSAAQTHLVRNWVVIPKGVTLTVTAGSVVKFTPGSGIWIEDGGKLDVQGSAEELVVFTHSADNSLGEQVSFEAEAEATMNAYAIVKGPNATFTDNGWLAAKWLDVATFGRITLHPATTAVTAGAVRVPVTLSGTRNAPFVLRWVAEEGSAKLGEDYTLAAGELSWSGTSEGTKHIVIPILDNPENTERRSFKVRADIVCGMNVSPDPVEVTLYRNGLETQLGAGSPFAWESRQSAAVRLDGRLDEAGAVASGSEAVHPWEGAACDGEALTSGAWETAALADAWHTLTLDDAARELLTLNDPGVRVVGGRLAEATQWTAEAVYVVRHWVVVPRGVTLQVAAGTVVKFLPGTGLWIEDGGTVEITGEAGQDVIFTDFEDDSAGGDTDRREPSEAPAQNRWQVKRAPSGTLKENGYWQVRGHTLGVNFATVAIQDALAREAQGEVWVPVTISGTRKAFFSLDWEAVSGTASVEEDLGETVSGTLAWSSTDQGTKFIRIPVAQDGVVEGCEQLTVRLTAVRGANASRREAAVTLYDSEPAADGEALAVSWESEGNQPTSPAATVRALQENFQDTLIVDGEQPFRYSPYWQAAAEDWRACTAEIACARTGAAEQRVLFRGSAGAEGEFLWRVQNLDDGELLLSHRVYGPDGTLRATTSRMLRYLSAAELHSGVIGEDTVWQAGKVHLVYGDVTVAAGVTLTIEPGAVVKFCDGTGLYGEDYTAVIQGLGVTFTHFADDTCGGDTNLDGSRSQPNYGTYTLGGHVVVDESSDIRCRQPQPLSSLLGDQSVTLKRGNVYTVDSNITFVSGTTLTIEPGVVVKFAANTAMTIASGATLVAQGTRAAPIVFTSIRDDANGGDTNGDGAASSPQPGDWKYVYVQGIANLTYTHLYYGAPSNETGIIETSGSGSLTMEGCVVAHGRYDGIWNWGGTIRVSNTIITDVSTAAAPYRGSNTYVNCVFAGVNTGVMCWGHWNGGDFVNTILWGCGSSWVNTGSSADIASASRFSHCVFYSPTGYALAVPSVVGQDGNMWGDPCFVDPNGGDFHIQPGSAAIDMADGAVAPETDFFGQPRMDVAEVDNVGSPTANGAFADAGIHELMPRTTMADVDLVVVSVEVPESGVVGQEVLLSWTVYNAGTKPVDGTWRDSLSLVNELGEEVPLSTVEVRGYIAPDGTKRTERTVVLPPMDEGLWHLKVLTNAYRDIFEGTLIENNVGSSAGIEISVMRRVAAEGWTLALSPNTETACAFDLAAGERVCVASLEPGMLLRWGFGFMPSERRESGHLGEDGVIALPEGIATVYCVVRGGAAQGILNLRFTAMPLALSGVRPSTLPLSGSVTVSIEGAGFLETSELHLVDAPAEALQAVSRVSDECLLAEVNCAYLQAGQRYSVEVVNGTESAILTDAFEVMPAPIPGRLWATLDVPTATRPGRLYTCSLTYGNEGELPLRAPVLQVRLESTSGALWYEGRKDEQRSLSFIGSGATKVAGMLAPGEARSVAFTYRAGDNDRFSLHTSEDKEFAPAPWSSTEAYLSALSSAATRVALRGGDAIWFDDVLALAQREAEGVLSQRIRGRVLTEGGSPVPYATVQATAEDVVVDFETDAQGVFLSPELTPGEWTLACAEGKASVHVSVCAGQDALGVTLRVVRNHAVSVTVQDDEGKAYQPTAAISLVAQCTQRETEMLSYVATPAANSTWRFVNLPQGGYTLVMVDGDMVGRSFVQVGAEDAIVPVSIKMKPCGTVTGQVDITGMVDPSLMAKGVEDVRFSLLDPDGNFRLERLPVGIWELSIYDAEGVDLSLGTVEVTFGTETVLVAPTVARLMSQPRAGVDLAFWRVRDAAREWLATARRTLKSKPIYAPQYDCPENQMRYQAYLRAQQLFEQQVNIFDFAVERYSAFEGQDVAKKAVILAVEIADALLLLYGKGDGDTFSDLYDITEDTIESIAAFQEGTSSILYDQVSHLLERTNAIRDAAKVFGESCDEWMNIYNQKMWYETSWEDVNVVLNLYESAEALVDNLQELREWEEKFRTGEYITGIKAEELGEKIYNYYKESVGIIKTKKSKLGKCLGFLKQLADLAVAARNAAEGTLAYCWDTNQLERETNVLREATLAYVRLRFNDYLDASVLPEACYPFPLETWRPLVPQSYDPNEMNGPAGLGEQRLVKPGEWMTYTIYFENKSDATGAAQEVRVTEQLDGALDWSTFEVLDVVYRNQVESGLAGLANGTATSALAGTAYKVRSQVAFDAATGQVEWYLRILDESTVDQWPADAYAGILPPNNAAHEGEGHITYRVKLRDDLADGTRVSATASIVFDANEPIETDPAWWNTIASALDTVAFEQSAIVVEAAQGYAELVVNGGSDRAATSVVLQRAGGSMVQGEDFYFPESITLTWAQGDRTPKHLYISFNPRAVSLGDKTLSFVLTDANGLLLESPKSCQITVKRHIPALTWPEAEAPSAVLSAWVTEAAARAFITDGPLTLAAGTSLAQLEQARELGIFPALEARSGGGADLAVDFTFTVGALLPLPEEDALTFNARIVVHQGSIATPYQPQLSFTLLGGCELDGSDWTPMTPTAIGTPTPLSDDEAIIPLRFAHPPVSTWFMRLKAN